jgi:hypothetical protein
MALGRALKSGKGYVGAPERSSYHQRIRPKRSVFSSVIRDPKTNALLWGITEHAQWAILQGNRERNFDQTLTRLVRQLGAASHPKVAPASRRPSK